MSSRHDDDWLTTQPAARILDTIPDKVRALVRRGVLPAIRTPSGQYIYRRSDVEHVARERQQRRPVQESAPATGR
jgi:predicted site-specific integrase-resolvase